jgi:dipeptidyl aminopeptidase/acylaminoacyl peptidase
LDNEITHQGTRTWLLGKTPDEETVKLYCNELQVTPRTPKAFIMHSSDDKAVPVENSLRYYRALVANGVSATMHLYPTGGHGWGFRDSFPYKAQWTQELEKWLREINK